jgi:hypothetical protein
MITVTIGLFVAVALGAVVAYRAVPRANPLLWYTAALTLIAVGTFPLMDLGSEADVTYALCLLIALVSFTWGGLITWHSLGGPGRYRTFMSAPVEPDGRDAVTLLWVLLCISIIVTVLYYRVVGYNMVSLVFVLGGVDDFSTMRLNAYAGERYLAAGYVNQFKNVLLPVCLLAIGLNARAAGRRGLMRILVIGGVPFLVWALAGAGQRTFLVYAFVSSVFGVAILARRTIISGKLMMQMLAVAALFVFSTSVYKSGTWSLDGGVMGVVAKSLERVTTDNQISGLVGFRYVYAQDIVWFEEWWEGLKGLLPGVRGSRLANIIHGLMYGGSERGTSPLTMVGSVYHNSGPWGVLIYHGLIGSMYAALYVNLLRGSRTIARCVAYGAMLFYLSIHVTGSISTVFDNGVVTIAILIGLMRVRWRARRRGLVSSGRSTSARVRQSSEIARLGMPRV